MESLTDLAFDSYVENGIWGAAKLSVPPHVIAERLETLYQLAPTHERRVQDYVRWFYEREGWFGWDDGWDVGWDVEDVRHPEGDFEVRAAKEETPSAEFGSRAEAGTSSAPELPTPNILEFCPRSQHGLKHVWEFHKGDADPYPAVPHGHERRNNKAQDWPKLDPYRGFVYDASGRQLKREPRQAIVALWNDPSFRSFAREALLHALEADRTLERRIRDERGIRDPHLLPGERG